MTILGKIKNSEEHNEIAQNEYKIPKVFNKKEKGLTLEKALFLSTLLHPISVGIIWLALFILALMGISFKMLEKPPLPQRDIEFVLVNKKEEMPLNKNTKYRADRNTRAGGKHDPKRAVSEPSPAAGAPSTPKKDIQKQNSTQDLVKQIQKKQAQQAQQAQKPKAVPTQQKPTPKVQQEQPAPKHVVPEQTAPPPRVTPTPSAPKVTQAPTSAMQIPIPKTTAPKLAGPSGGPVTGSRIGTGAKTGGSATGTPTPTFSPSSSSSTSGAQGRFSNGQYGLGQAGNPSPGNPNGAPGIDALKSADFGPYMRELQRRIKMNWDPPKGNESKRVVLLFKIAKDGRLLSVRVAKSSGIQAADKAALSAVELTAPFKPLPPEYKGNSVDIQFTFDYNVFGASGY